MNKEEILNEINDALDSLENDRSRNSMGVYEKYYSPFYMVGKCFTMEELEKMSKETLDNLLKLAGFAGEVFY